MRIFRIAAPPPVEPPGDLEWWHRFDPGAHDCGVQLDADARVLALPGVFCEACGLTSSLFPTAMEIPEEPAPETHAALDEALGEYRCARKLHPLPRAYASQSDWMEAVAAGSADCRGWCTVSPVAFRRLEAVVRRLLGLPHWRPVTGGARIGPCAVVVNHSEYPDLMMVGWTLLASERAAALFREAGFTGVSWHPVKVTRVRERARGRRHLLYELVVHGVARAPEGQSEAFHRCAECGRHQYVLDDERQIRWKLDTRTWDGCDWFRFMETPAVWVTEEVQHALEQSGLFLGVSLTPGDQTFNLNL